MTRQFLVDINPNMELPKYELILYSLTGLPITSLKNITNFNYKAYFIGIDEISFNIPAYRSENDGRKVKNEIYDLVDGEYYILLNDKKYFIIDEIKEKADDDGNIYKEVHAYSREYELSQKKLVDYKADSRVLYDSSNTMLDGLEKGVLNYIFNHITKSWSIGDVDADIILRDAHRALDFPNTNLIQVFQELQETFNCIFKFDTINQKIDVIEMDPSKIGQNQGLYISNGNFIKSLSKNIKYDEVKTRLFLYGKDNVSIQSISPTGQPFLDNFDAFKNTKFMTQGLIDALDAYQTKIENYNPNFEPLLAQLQQANQVMEDLINADHPSDLNLKGLVALERALSIVQTQIDVKVEELAIIKKSIESATGTDLENMYADMRSIQSAIEMYDTEKANINTLIKNKRDEINNQQIIIDGIKQQISDLQYALDMNNPSNFTTEQLKELDKFIRVETYNDTNYTEHNITELYEEGKKILARISQPKIQFDVDVVDFLSVVECQHVWKKFVLGDIVTLEHRELGFDYEVRLVGYEHDYENNRLNLKFSNTYTFDDDTLWMRDLLEEINTTATAVDFNKYKWDKTDSMESKIARMVDAKLEETRQSILSAVGQRYLHDDSGLWLYKENPDGSINPEQIRAINNTIALTKDNFNTVSTAITPDGVVAENIYGKLGQFAKVNAEQIEVGGWDGEYVENNLKDYIDQQNSELSDSIGELDDIINNAFNDNYITNIEANSLDLARNSVIKEANDVKNIATSLGVSTTAITTAIDNLNTEVNKYVGKSSYPIYITLTDRTNITNAFTSLESAIAQLYKSIDEKRISNANTSLINYIDNINDNLTELIDGKIDTWFYAVEPTLSNPPANSWTTNAIKDKHINDLYYNTATGYVYRFTKVGTDYSWQRIMDSDITKALSDASTAQATADGKMTVYISQPTPPYHVGDLWRETADATDLKICTTERLTGDFVASDWSNATNVSGALSRLQDSINDFSSDLKLTLSEANSLKTLLESVTSESLELISTATALGITTEKTNYSTSLTTLTNYLNTNWLGKTYPLTITVAQRTTVNNYFKDLENKKSILLTKITEVRAIKEVNDKAVVKGTLYNGVKIDAESGFVATRTDNKVRTIVNATDGIKIQKNRGTTQYPNWVNSFYTDINGNVILGEDSQISWSSISNKPTIPTQYTDAQAVQAWKNSGYATNITSTGLYTGTIIANQVVSGLLQSTDKTTWINLTNGSFNFKNALVWSGNKMQVVGDFITYSGGRKAVEITGNSLFVYDWQGTRATPVGELHSARELANNAPSLTLSNHANSILNLSYLSGNTYYPYISLDYYNVKSDTIQGIPITLWEDMNLAGTVYLGYNADASMYVGNRELVIVGGRNGWSLNQGGYANILYDTNYDEIRFYDGSYFIKYVDILGNLYVRGRKDGLHTTENYGERLISAYETTEYYYGDIGSGIINENGECLIHIDEIFQECVNTNINYHIFIQKYNGRIDNIRKEKFYFVVYGEPNTEFSWELKAKRIGYENQRLEVPNKEKGCVPSTLGGNTTEIDMDNNRDVKRILEGELEFDLSNILLTDK